MRGPTGRLPSRTRHRSIPREGWAAQFRDGRCRWREDEYWGVEPLRAEHSSASFGSRRGLAEVVAVVLGLTSIILYAALKLTPWVIEPGNRPLDEAFSVFVPYLLFGPPLVLRDRK